MIWFSSEVLIKEGARIDGRDSTGHTPLHRAVLNERTEAIFFLLQKGARVDLLDMNGNTPHQLALASHLRIAPFLLLN